MKKRLYISAFLVIFLIGSITCCFYFKHKLLNNNKLTDDLINISKLPKEFMNNYFKEVSEIKEDEKDNILIVISEEKLKETYGAKKIIDAPNNQYILQYDNLKNKDKAFNKLKNDPSIIVQENITYTFSNVDGNYNSWGVEKMGLDDAIEFANSQKLNDITVAIIDTGCDMDLFNENYSGKIEKTYNILTSDSDMFDNYGHGTHIAGTIAESTPNNVKILPVKVSDDKSIDTVKIVAAVNYIVQDKKADVINMSFGSERNDLALDSAIEAAKEQNIISVAAAGNESTSDKSYPAALDTTIAISSVDSSLNKSDFSNYGRYITFTAPGTDIESINGKMSGTSMATPHAVSSVAILKSLNKDLTIDDAIELLKIYAQDLGDEGWDEYYGYGLISFNNAKFCDNSQEDECDEYGIFSKSATEITKIEVTNIKTTDYNYYSVNNLFPTEILIHYNDGRKITRTLGKLENIEIEGYNPNSNTQQTVTIKYDGLTEAFNITNPRFEDVGWEYNILDSSNIELTHYKDNNQKYLSLYFPETINEYNVVSLADSTSSSSSDMFKNSKDFEYFKIINLPKTISKIGKNVFRAEKILSQDSKSTLEKVIINSPEIEINENAFMYNYKLTTFNGVISKIGSQAFSGCEFLDNIKLAEKITRIENGAFSGCSKLEHINIPESITYIGSNAFSGTNIKSIDIPDGVKTIESNTFFNCENLETVNLPESIEQINAMAFVNSGINSIIIPKKVKEIKDHAFYACKKLKEVYIPRSVDSIATNSFDKNTQQEKIDLTIYTYSDAYAKEYAKNNKIKYETLNPEITINANKTSYKAFEKVTSSDISSISLNFEKGYNKDNEYKEETNSKTITDGYTIKYINNLDSFRFNHSYYTVIINDIYNETYEKNVNVNVSKATPNYEKPNNLKAKVNMKLSDIDLPTGFEWMDKNQTITEVGEQTFLAKYTPEDTENYEVIENIELSVNVYNTNIIFNYTKDYEGIYDGQLHSLDIKLDIDDYEIEYSVDDTDYGSKVPSFMFVGEYTVKYKVTAEGYETLMGSNKVKIYGIRGVNPPLSIRDNVVITKNKSFSKIIERFNYFANEIAYSHYESSNELTTSDDVKTKDIVRIKINNTKDFDYKIALAGDINGDGEITSKDYIKIRKHIMGSEVITDKTLFYAADINLDEVITSKDYIKIRKHIMGTEFIE